MKLLVFGASGATGRHVVRQGLDQGLAVTAFVRDPARLAITHPQLTLVPGNVGDQDAVERVVAGQDAVVSTLGVGAPLKHDQVVIDGVRHIVGAMSAQGVRRLVYMSFIGVGDSRSAAGFVVRRIAVLPLRHEIRDHEVKEGLVTSSELEWTIVRPPTLTNGVATGTYRVGTDIAARSALPTLSRADVADVLLRQLTDSTFIGKVLRVQP